MVGFPLFAHVGREKKPTTPLKVIKFPALKQKNRHFRCSSAAPGWSGKKQKREESRIVVRISAVLSVTSPLPPPPQNQSSPRKLIKFPMSAARHEKGKNSAMGKTPFFATPAEVRCGCALAPAVFV